MKPKSLLFTALAALITSCASKESVQVKFIHAAAGSGSADIYFQDAILAPGISAAGSAGYFNIERKEKEPYYGEIRSHDSGAILGTVNNPAWNSGKRYTVVLFGNNNQLSKELFGDSYSVPPSGKANLRFMHFAPDMPGADVYLDQELLFDDVSYYGDNIFNGTRPFTLVNAGTHNIEIRSNTRPERRFARTFVLEPGNTYTLFSCGNAGSEDSAAFTLDMVLH